MDKIIKATGEKKELLSNIHNIINEKIDNYLLFEQEKYEDQKDKMNEKLLLIISMFCSEIGYFIANNIEGKKSGKKILKVISEDIKSMINEVYELFINKR